MHLACQKFYNIKHGNYEESTDYHKRFKTIVDVLDHYRANIWAHPSLIMQEYRDTGNIDISEENIYNNMKEFNKHKLSIKNKFIAFAFLKGAQRDMYGNLAFHLRSQYAREINQYPKTLNQALRLLSTHEDEKKERQNDSNRQDKDNGDEEKSQEDNEEMAFIQNTNRKLPECFLCGGEHYVTTCPYRNQFKKVRINEQRKAPPVSANSMLINNTTCQEIDDDTNNDDKTSNVYDFLFTNISTHPITSTQKITMSQNAKGRKINKYWVLLDSQSTISILNNTNLLTNIRKCNPDEKVRCYCNRGYQDTDMMGSIKGLGGIYYNPNSLANILSLADVYNKGFHITLDTDIDPAFKIHNTSMGDIKFVRSNNGLHYYDIITNNNRKEFSMLQTAQQNKGMFNKRELTAADEAIKMYQTIGRPGYQVFYDSMQRGLIKNCKITAQDAKNAFTIYGPDEGALRGKMVRTTPKKVETKSLFQLPKEIFEKHKFVTIAIDIFYFDSISFFLTISRNIHFYTIEKIEDRENKTIMECLKR